MLLACLENLDFFPYFDAMFLALFVLKENRSGFRFSIFSAGATPVLSEKNPSHSIKRGIFYQSLDSVH